MCEILKLLEHDSTYTPAQIAAMLDMDEAEVAEKIQEYENSGVILGYKTVIDWDRTEEELVTAMIDVHVTPQRDSGFGRVAERIYQYDEVQSLYLMSGGYDLSVVIAGRTMKEVALFVAEKLATIDGVSGTATHFILKKYKDGGVLFQQREEQQERIEMV